MKKPFQLALIGAALVVTALILPLTANAYDNTVTFQRTDEPGRWFKNLAGPIAGTQSLAVAPPGVLVTFTGNNSHAVHTVTSLLFPTGASGMPFDAGTLEEDQSITVTLNTPGLYV